MRAYCVMTVDIKGSTRLGQDERRGVQENIFNILKGLGTVFEGSVVTASMTTGDEFQVVLESPREAIGVYKFILREMRAGVHVGAGVGEIESVEEASSPSEMYGPAFYRAREAIEVAKGEDVHIYFKTGDDEADFELNTVLELLGYIRDGWTDRQREIIDFIDTHRESLQKEVAKELRVSEAMISKTIRNTGYEKVRKGELLAREILGRLGGR